MPSSGRIAYSPVSRKLDTGSWNVVSTVEWDDKVVFDFLEISWVVVVVAPPRAVRNRRLRFIPGFRAGCGQAGLPLDRFYHMY